MEKLKNELFPPNKVLLLTVTRLSNQLTQKDTKGLTLIKGHKYIFHDPSKLRLRVIKSHIDKVVS